MKKLFCFFAIFLGACIANTRTAYATITVDQVNSCIRDILGLFEEYCDDEDYRTSSNVGAAPSYGEYSLSSGKIYIGCYKYKKNRYKQTLKTKLHEKCNFAKEDIEITEPERPSSHVGPDAPQTITVHSPTPITISGTVLLRDTPSSSAPTRPCQNCTVKVTNAFNRGPDKTLGTTNSDGTFSFTIPDKNEFIVFSNGENYAEERIPAPNVKDNIHLTLRTISGLIKSESGNGIRRAMVTNLDNSNSTQTANNASGQFLYLAALPHHQIQITASGYTPQTVPASTFTNSSSVVTLRSNSTSSSECPQTDPNHPGAIVFERASDGNCYPTACDDPRYKLTGTGTSAKCQEQKCEISNADRTEWTGEKNAWKCIVLDCKDKYKKNDDSTACIEMLRECTDAQNAAHPNATQTGIKSGTETCIALECECGHDLVNEQCVKWPEAGKECTANTKPELPSHATGAIMKCDANGKPYCEISGCENNYTKNDSNTKCEKLRGECTHSDPNAKKAKYKKVDGNRICVITKCNDGYMPSDDGKKCEVSEGPCNEAQLATVENATKGELKKGKCRATECKPGYEVEKHKCVEIAGNCPDKPENAKKSHREFDSNTQAEVCIIDECKDGYKVSDDSKSCIEIEKPKLSREDSQKKIDELQKNADAMKEKEQSTANKLLGGAAIGATGIGAMQAASAYSEQQADEEAEQAMKAYLATFHCNYGGGINVPGGEKDVQLPGGNELIDLYAEYVNLANNLKVRKAALDLRPGIESEAILDSATSGLYDDVAIGKTSGAFTSLARALQDPEGEDAKAWAAQKDASAKKMKTGLTIAGIGAIGGAVGNLLINKDSEKENSKEINAKYEKLKKKMEQVQSVVNALPKPTCNDFISQGVNGGTYPNCTCSNTAARFFTEQGCITCETGKQYNEQNECVAIPPAGCTKDGVLSPGTCNCVANATLNGNTCECNAGYENKNGMCEQTTTPTIAPKTEEQTIKLNIPADVTFDSGKSTLKANAKTKIAAEITNALSGTEGANDIKSFSIEITGHTDRVPFKSGSSMTNQKLSEERANAIKDLFVAAGVKKDTITTSGKAADECTTDKYPKRNDEGCRRVDVTISVDSGTGLSDILQDINIGELAGKLSGNLMPSN